ncbi:MAG: hypothetical protein EHM50_02850 [Lysobacterales bacterium]|nr:MAG: hypothetical protein EHM50_02850 [Xanthomonadales bacterium]
MRIVAAFIAVVLLASAPLERSVAQRGSATLRIAVQSLEPLPSSSGQQRFRVALVVDNMDTDPVKIRGIEFKLRIADEGIIDGKTPPLTIEALDRQTLMLDVGSEIISSLSRLLSFVHGPENTLPYEIYGKVTLDRRMIDPLSFSASGQVPLVMTSER